MTKAMAALDVLAGMNGAASPESKSAQERLMIEASTLSAQELAQLAKAARAKLPNAIDAAHVSMGLLVMAAEKDPGIALETAAALDPDSDFFGMVLHEWAARDMAAANAWYQRAAVTLESIPGIKEMAANAFASAAEGDRPGGAPHLLEAVLTEDGARMRDSLIKTLRSPAARQQFFEAIAKCEDRGKHARLLDLAGRQAALTMDLDALRDLCATAPLTDSDKLRLCTATVTGSIDERTPERAAWMLTLCPDTASKSAAAVALTAEWARQDFNAAGNWIKSLTKKDDLPVRDAASAKFAEVVTPVEPAAAAAWAHTISDATLREETLRRVLTAWSQKDRSSATAFLSSKNLPLTLLSAE
jgi:hypothetical protein